MVDKQLVCMMGLPRAGKSTVARALSEAWGAPVVNRDAIRAALHGQRFVGSAEPMVKAIAGVMVDALFGYHDIVIVDETNLKPETRAFWSAGHEPVLYLHVKTPVELCLARATSTDDDRIQPVIKAMAQYTVPLDSRTERELEALPTNVEEAIQRAQTQWPKEGD